MFRSKKGKEGKDVKAEDRKGRFTLKRSKAKKKNGGSEQGHEISDPLGYIPPAAFANANPPHGQPHVGGDAYAVMPQQGVQARALYEYDPEQEDEIQLKEGDIVAVYERDESGWWTGECRGKYGLFPGAFVELIGAEPGVAFPQYHPDHPNVNASATELEALPSSSSMASLEGPDAEASQEILSYLEEGLHDNGLTNGEHTEEASELSHSGELHHQHHSQDEDEGGPVSEETQQPDHEELASAPESDGAPEVQTAEAPETEAPEAEAPPQEIVERYRTPSSSSTKVATRLPEAAENEQHVAHPAVDGEATAQTAAPAENGGTAGEAVAYQGWEQERAEWEQHSREWEHSYDVLSAEFEAVKQERADILQQLDQLRQAHDQQAMSLDAVQKQLEEQKRVNESEKATADSQLLIIQRLEEQLQEAEREKVQAQASTLSAEANAEEIARLHSLLSDEGKLRESAERALEEERKRSAELAEQLRSEQQLRAEAETKLQQANKEVHERVAKVEETLLRHLQDTKAQLAAAIQSRPSSRPSSTHSSSSPSVASSAPSSNASNSVPAPVGHHPQHHHTPAHQPSATTHSHGPAHPPSGVGHQLRPTPAGARPPSAVAGGPGSATPHHQLRPVGAGGANGPHPMQRPVPPSVGQAPGGPGGAAPGAARGRGAPPTRGGVPPAVRGRGEPMQRPQIPPGSQKPPLNAQPVGPRMVPIGGTARAAVSRPPPGRPRGSTAHPTAAGPSVAPPAIVQ